jgi:hypothetical protein
VLPFCPAGPVPYMKYRHYNIRNTGKWTLCPPPPPTPLLVGTAGGPLDPVELGVAQQRYTATSGARVDENDHDGPDEGIAAVCTTRNPRTGTTTPIIWSYLNDYNRAPGGGVSRSCLGKSSWMAPVYALSNRLARRRRRQYPWSRR